MAVLDLRGHEQFTGKPHYTIAVGEQTLAYCYIRKNACSAFKSWMLAESPHSQEKDESALQFLNRHHKASLSDVRTSAFRVCVLRDPLARVVSAYRNKFIQQSGHADIFANYGRITGRSPQSASFADFVQAYLSRPFEELDPHMWSQAAHLLPVRYNVALLMDEVPGAMARILGKSRAAAHFAKRHNASSGFTEVDEDVSAAPASVLHERFVAEGLMPSNSALLAPSLADQLRELYAADYQVLEWLT